MEEQRTNSRTALDEQETGEHEVPQQAGADEVVKLKAERDELFDRLARAQAEFDNYRKRSQREQEEFRQYAVGEAIKQFIPILDNFNLALKQQPASAHKDKDKDKDSDLRKGVELIRKQMEEALAKLGVRAVEAQGAEFDPHHHEAIEMVESDEHADNHVVEELQRGYKLRDRLLRPAMVKVAKRR